MKTVLDFTADDLAGVPVDLARYRGDVLLIVNTASHCGFTPQYEGLEALYRQFKNSGFTVLGFPCNQFGKQEPGNADTILNFCKSRFAVSFPILGKVEVNGPRVHPLFRHLKLEAPGFLGTTAIKWNFTKFLVKRDGSVFKRYAPNTQPEDLVADIKSLLAEHAD